MNTRSAIAFAAVLGCLLALPADAFAIAGKDKIVSGGEKAKSMPGWPTGVMKVINHPLRTDGWHPWFSECSNDSRYFVMKVRGTDDVNALLKVLAAIKSKKIRLRLDPTSGAAYADGAGVVFSIGNQPILDRWFKRLPEVKPGVRRFGVHRYRKPPLAQPPTLTVHIGHKGIDLKTLAVPLNVEITAPTAESYRKRYEEQCDAIDEFIDRHRTKQKQSK